MPASIHFKALILASASVILSFSVVYCGSPASILALERAFPANQRVELEVLKARDKARHARMLQGVVGGVVDFYVYGLSDPYLAGLYYTKVKLGSPPREFNVQIDTGSDVLWVNCISCNGCPQSSGLGVELNFFDVSSSSTASLVSCSDPICSSVFQTTATGCSSQSNQCSYSLQYEDDSGTSGYYISDMLYFDIVMGNSFIANSSASIIFGCSNYHSGSLTMSDRAIDGIFGFGQHDWSVISQLSSRGITPKVFSHCLRGDNSGGGILVLGEILAPSIVYSPLVPSQPHYNLVMESIAVNGQLLPIDPTVFTTSTNQGTIVDSGTTLAYLVEKAYDPFVGAVTATVSQFVTPYLSKGNQCYLVSTSIADVFPSVNLNFAGGASMLLKPEEYLMRVGFTMSYSTFTFKFPFLFCRPKYMLPSRHLSWTFNSPLQDDAASWCIGFQKAQDHRRTILGDLVLKDKIFVYDLARQRIGWANFDCSLSVNVSVTSSKDEFFNAGQLSVSSSYRNLLFELIPMSTAALLMHVFICIVFVVP